MSTQTNCPQSELSGFPPTPETVQDWMDKLTANGITEGVLCRLVHGRDEGKIVKFENYEINDLGVYTEGGYFLHSDKVIKVAEPLYKPLLKLTEDVKFLGGVFEGSVKFFCPFGFGKTMIATINEYNELLMVEEVFEFNHDKANLELFQFRTAQDLFAWMALND